MKRRTLVIGGTLLLAGSSAARAASPVVVIYVGGWDCPYCIAWKNQSRADWLASDIARRVRYVEVESPSLKEAYQERYWPEDLRPVLEQVPHKAGTPRFLVVKRGKLVANTFGTNKWPKAVEAARKALG